MKSVNIFCGSSEGLGDKYLDLAEKVGIELAKRNFKLVYGGANIGVMGKVANAVLENGGKVLGVMPEVLVKFEVAHMGLTELKIVDSMHARKKLMYDSSDCFVTIPGGIGTLDEFCEIVTWSQLGKHNKPCYLLNVFGFYDHLIAHFDKIVEEGFLSKRDRELIRVVNTVEELFEKLS